tara:strand:- start:17386 stop:17826 length:441 start_codon:yes stop_codon:yes gene_type:complete
MRAKNFQILFAILLAATAGILGAFAADRWIISDQEYGLHDFVHRELDLSAGQETQLDDIERKFSSEHRELEFALRAANARLAQAMEDEHEYGPKVVAAIDGVHDRMEELQMATIRHVFTMRNVLTPAQQRKFDRQVSNALTGAARE